MTEIDYRNLRGENQPDRPEPTQIVLWHGQYRNDAEDWLTIYEDLPGSWLWDVHIEGVPADWRIVGMAYPPRERTYPMPRSEA